MDLLLDRLRLRLWKCIAIQEDAFSAWRVDVITFRGTLGLPDKRSSLNSIPDSYRERTAKRAAYL